MYKLSLLFLACAVLSSCGIGSKADGGWTYDLPEGGFEAPETGEALETSEAPGKDDIGMRTIDEDQETTLGGETAESKAVGAVAGAGAFSQLSDAETRSEPSESVLFETNLPVAGPDENLELSLPQRGPRPATPSLLEQPTRHGFERTSRFHHRSIVSPFEPPIKPVESDDAAVEVPLAEPFPRFGTHQQGTPASSDTPSNDISELNEPEPNAIDLNGPQSDEISDVSDVESDDLG